MHIISVLLWETEGRPRCDQIVLSDEGDNGSGGAVVVLDDQGHHRAAAPDELPRGSVILVPSEVSSEQLAVIQRAGYSARHSTLATTEADQHTVEPAATGNNAAPKRSRKPPSRSRRAAIAEAELEDVADRLEADLRRRRPDLFDSAGRLCPDRYAREVLKLTGGKRWLTREEVLGLGRRPSEVEDEPRILDGT